MLSRRKTKPAFEQDAWKGEREIGEFSIFAVWLKSGIKLVTFIYLFLHMETVKKKIIIINHYHHHLTQKLLLQVILLGSKKFLCEVEKLFSVPYSLIC